MAPHAGFRVGVRKAKLRAATIFDPLTGSGALAGSSAATGQTWVSFYSNGVPLQRTAIGAGYNPSAATSQEYVSITTSSVVLDLSAKISFDAAATQCTLMFRGGGAVSDAFFLLKSNVANQYILRKNVSGSATDFFTGGVPATGDTIRITDTGSVITFYVNGVQLAQVTDTTYNTNKKVGFGCYTAGTSMSAAVRDFTAIVG